MTPPRSSHDDPLYSMLSPPSTTPSWVSPRRPFTVADAPSSPASSTASQKFEVKRLLSRPADPACLSSPRPFTTYSASPAPSATFASSSDTPAVPVVPLSSLKRSNSFGKSFLKRRPSRGSAPDLDPATPKQRTAPLAAVIMPSYALPDSIVPTPTLASSTDTNTTPASAYARAYAQRTNMSAAAQPSPGARRPSEPEPGRPRPRRPSQPHLIEGGTGKVVAIGDPSDDSLAPVSAGLVSSGSGVGPSKKPAEEGFRSGLTRKVSARFRRRKNSNPNTGAVLGVQSDVEGEPVTRKSVGHEEWSREKERAVLRGMGLSGIHARYAAAASVSAAGTASPRAADLLSPKAADTADATGRLGQMNRNRLSRHLSIEDFRGLFRVEQEMGASFEMWTPPQERGRNKAKEKGLDKAKSPERGVDVDSRADKDQARKRAASVSRRTRHDPAISREKEKEGKRLATAAAAQLGAIEPVVRKDATQFSSSIDDSHASRKDESAKRSTVTRSNSTPSPEQSTSPESHKGGKIWRLVKKMSAGTLKEKKSYQTEKAPPVPPLPSSRRSSVLDYGEEVRPELARFSSSGRYTYYEPTSAAASIRSGPSSLSGHATVSQPQPQPQPQPPSQSRHRTTSGSRPSLTNESSAASTSPKSSFGRTQSPRTSMSSYVDLGDEVVPPLPLGKHIVSPGELAQQYSPALPRAPEPASVAASPSLPPPKRPRKPRDKPTSPAATDTPVKARSKPNVLRRPTRLADVPLPGRSPRSASMGMPSPRAPAPTPAPATLEEPLSTPRPRSNSLGTVFTFREMGASKADKLTEQEKVAKFEQLLEASEKAGGTLHARAQERLLSDTMRLSVNFDANSVSGL